MARERERAPGRVSGGLWGKAVSHCFLLLKVSFDSTKHLSDASIKKRQLERQKLQELEQQREEQKRREKEAEERQRAEERYLLREGLSALVSGTWECAQTRVRVYACIPVWVCACL